MAKVFGQPVEGLCLREAALKAVEALRQLAEDLQVPSHLSDFGVTEEHIPGLADGVMKVTRLLGQQPPRIDQKRRGGDIP